ncbi:hypothetical protein DEJ49_30530 [Streptomyces venezuelae]|uniref:Uncharacterized protein n=1 Tax=Streptomyces venezuelae TaxID=54571 RepID=A0A5P2CPD0_STRVZ|nr:hypothetical protein [Streptomyces venezuelae]QES44756.1 hypothetical protein DEJ49_30530 [Streptomyces venezuelae]
MHRYSLRGTPGVRLRTLVIVLISATIAAVIPFQAQASDRRDEPGRQSYERLVKNGSDFRKKYVKETPEKSRELIERTKEKVLSGKIAVHLPEGAGIDEAGATVRVSRSTGTRIVYLPYAGTAAVPSMLATVYDRSGRVTQTIEHVYQAGSDGSVRVRVWTDGKATLDKTASPTGEVSGTPKDASTAAESVTPISPQKLTASTFWERFKACMIRQGYTMATIAAIAATCSACVAGPLACIPCLVTIGITEFAAIYCVYNAS